MHRCGWLRSWVAPFTAIFDFATLRAGEVKFQDAADISFQQLNSEKLLDILHYQGKPHWKIWDISIVKSVGPWLVDTCGYYERRSNVNPGFSHNFDHYHYYTIQFWIRSKKTWLFPPLKWPILIGISVLLLPLKSRHSKFKVPFMFDFQNIGRNQRNTMKRQ